MTAVWEKRLFVLMSAVFVILIITILGLIVYTSIQRFFTSLPKLTGYEEKVYYARLLPADVPLRYRGPLTRLDSDFNGVYGQRYVFHADGLVAIASIVHEIVIFDTATEAEKTLIDYSKDLGKITLQEMKSTDSQAKSFYADRLVSGCRQPEIVGNAQGWSAQTRWCVTIGVYQNIFVEIDANIFDVEGLLTMADYEQIIETVDARVAKVFNVAQ